LNTKRALSDKEGASDSKFDKNKTDKYEMAIEWLKIFNFIFFTKERLKYL
jgi:hypothetical protein